MAQSKKDLSRGNSKVNKKIAELKEKMRFDPLGKNRNLQDQLAKLEKKQK